MNTPNPNNITDCYSQAAKDTFDGVKRNLEAVVGDLGHEKIGPKMASWAILRPHGEPEGARYWTIPLFHMDPEIREAADRFLLGLIGTEYLMKGCAKLSAAQATEARCRSLVMAEINVAIGRLVQTQHIQPGSYSIAVMNPHPVSMATVIRESERIDASMPRVSNTLPIEWANPEGCVETYGVQIKEQKHPDTGEDGFAVGLRIVGELTVSPLDLTGAIDLSGVTDKDAA